jgi:exopolysaccharide biosynthesis polyprenyl glycosylphosphotransferase
MPTTQQEKSAILFLIDIGAMFIAVLFALAFGHRDPMSMALVSEHLASFFIMIASVVLIFFILDGYTLRKLPEAFWDQTPSMAIGLLLSAVLTTFIFFFFRNPVPRAVFILFHVISLVLIVAARGLFQRLTLHSVFLKILIVGDQKRSENLAAQINRRNYLGARVIGFVSTEAAPGPSAGLPCLGGVKELLSVIDKSSVDQIVVATSKVGDDLNRLLLECMHRKVRISDYWRKMEDVMGKVPIDYLDDYWFTLSLSRIDKRYFWVGKRLFDVMVSLMGLFIALPLFILAAFLIKIDSRGPVFYSQRRIGRARKPFRVWKLRTMAEGADKNNVHWTLDHDARITRAGKLLRKIRFDEVPQLFNILVGDMSLVGPRPEAVSLVELYSREIPYYLERHSVTPGVTGWAQINYRYGNTVDDAREKLMYDFYYIKNRGPMLDAVIILKTIRIVLTGKGAV